MTAERIACIQTHLSQRCLRIVSILVSAVWTLNQQLVFANELPVLNALARKGGVMRETTPEQAEAGVVFQGEFPAWEEDEIA